MSRFERGGFRPESPKPKDVKRPAERPAQDQSPLVGERVIETKDQRREGRAAVALNRNAPGQRPSSDAATDTSEQQGSRPQVSGRSEALRHRRAGEQDK